MARCSILSVVMLLHVIVLATAIERDRSAHPKRLVRSANPLLADISPAEYYITIMRTDGGEKFACSGVLVAADMALTAASCYCNDTASMCRLTGNTYIALFGTDNQASAASTNVKQIRIHPNFNGDPSAGYDFAAIKLDEAVPKIVEGVLPVPIIYTNDLYCHDTVVQAFSWPEDGSELIRFTGNTSADTVGQRGVQVWNSALNSSKYTWPSVCEQSDCEPSIVVAHGIGDEYCTLNPGAPLFRQVGNQTGLVGLFSFGLMNGTRCTGKLPDGGQAPQYFAQASAAIPFLQALGATIRQPLGSVCGDGRKGLSEQCDDGNTRDGDGCSSECKSEKGWVCSTYHKLNEEVCWKSSCSKLDGNGSSSKSGIITGAIIGGVVGAVALAIIPIVLVRRRRHHRKSAAAATRAPTTPATGGPPGSARARTGIKRTGEDVEASVVGGTKVPILSAPPPTPANGIISVPRGATALSPAVLTGTAGGVHAPSIPAGYLAGSEDPQSPTTGSNSGSQRTSDAPNRTG